MHSSPFGYCHSCALCLCAASARRHYKLMPFETTPCLLSLSRDFQFLWPTPQTNVFKRLGSRSHKTLWYYSWWFPTIQDGLCRSRSFPLSCISALSCWKCSLISRCACQVLFCVSFVSRSSGCRLLYKASQRSQASIPKACNVRLLPVFPKD